MQEFLNELIPNVMAKLPDFYAAIGDTLLQDRGEFWNTKSSIRSWTSW